MKHDDPNSVLVEPGKPWNWSDLPKSGALQVACNIPGHSEAGMVRVDRHRSVEENRMSRYLFAVAVALLGRHRQVRPPAT